MTNKFLTIILILSALTLPVAAQTSNYPGALDTNSTLFVTANNLQTTLTNGVALTDTSLVVQSTTGFTANMLVSFSDSREIVFVCSVAGANILNIGTASSCPSVGGRGFDGTAATVHAQGSTAGLLLDSAHTTSLKNATIAIETALGANLNNINTVVSATAYNFPAQSPSGFLTGNSPATVTLPNGCPRGVNGNDQNHWLLLSVPTEPVLITGGTCTSGASSGTITFTPPNNHSAGYTIYSATSGIQEAIQAVATTGGGRVSLSAQTYPVYAHPILPSNVSMAGTGNASIVQLAAGTWPNNAPGPSPTDCANLSLRNVLQSGVCDVIETTSGAINVHVMDFAVDWNKTGQTGYAFGGVVDFSNASNGSIERISVINAANNGFEIGLIGGSSGNTIESTWTHGNAADSGLGSKCTARAPYYNFGPGAIFVQGPHNTIHANQMLDGWCDTGFATNGTISADNVITDNHFVGGSLGALFGFQVDVGSRNVIADNTCEGLIIACFVIDPFPIQQTPTDNIISGNKVVCGTPTSDNYTPADPSGNTYGIWSKGPQTGFSGAIFGTQIDDNSVFNCTFGITVWQTQSQIHVRGNRVFNGLGSGILVTDQGGAMPQSVAIEDNYILNTVGPGIEILVQNGPIIPNGFTITGNIATDNQGPHTQVNGLYMGLGSSASAFGFVIANNNFSGNLSLSINSSLAMNSTNFVNSILGPNITDQPFEGSLDLSVPMTAPNVPITVSSQFYNFTQQLPGGTLSASTPANVTFPTGCPPGVAGADAGHWLHISGGTGTAEPVLITGGTCTSNGTGYVTFTPANNHSGSWLIGSATAGNQEAINICGGACTVSNPSGTPTFHAPITIPTPASSALGYVIQGAGRESTVATIGSDFPTSACGVFCFTNSTLAQPPPFTLQDMGFEFAQPFGSCSSPCSLSGFTHWPAMAKVIGGKINARRLLVDGAWTGFYVHGYPDNTASVTVFGGQSVFDDVQISAYGPLGAFNLDAQADQDRLDKVHCWPYTNGINTFAAQSAYYGTTVRCLVMDGGSEGAAQTTGTASSGSTALTIASGTGTVNGQSVFGPGIANGATVSSGGGTTSIVLSANTTAALTSASTTATCASGANVCTLASGTGTINGQIIAGTNIPTGAFVVSGGGTTTVYISQVTTGSLSTTAVTLTTPLIFANPDVGGSAAMLSEFESNAGVAIDMGNVSTVTASNSWFETFGTIKGGWTGSAFLNISGSKFFHNSSVASVNCTQPGIYFGNQASSVTLTANVVQHYCPGSPFIDVVNPVQFNGNVPGWTVTGNSISADSSFSGNTAQPSVFVFDGTQTGGASTYANINANTISYLGNVTYVQPMLLSSGAAFGLQFQDNLNAGVGTGTWVKIGGAPATNISGNTAANNFGLGAWSMALNTPTVASATAFALPFSNTFIISGTTTITSVTGQTAGTSGTFTTTGIVPFTGGASISTSCTTAVGYLYTWTSDGTKFYINGHGC